MRKIKTFGKFEKELKYGFAELPAVVCKYDKEVFVFTDQKPKACNPVPVTTKKIIRQSLVVNALKEGPRQVVFRRGNCDDIIKGYITKP